MLKAESICRALGGKPSGGGFVARCPAHDDKTPSLTIADGDSGVVVKCHAGCSQRDVIDALRARGAWPDNGDRPSSPREEYDYLDASGAKVVTVVRRDLDDGKRIHREPKGVRKPAGGYPLYRLADVTARADLPVLIVEGERTADCAHDLFGDRYAVATTIGGAGKAGQSDLSPLADRDVVIWPDADAPGRTHAEAIAGQCAAASVRIVATDGLPEGWDLADAPPPEFDREGGLNDSLPYRVGRETGMNQGGAVGWEFIPQDDFMARPIPEDDYAVDDLFPRGGVSLAVGKPKCGKSTGLRVAAVAISRGDPYLGRTTRRGKVLYSTLEERLPLVQRHFAAMGVAGKGNLYIHTGPAPADDPINALDHILADMRPVALIADPLFKLFRVGDMNDYTQVGEALEKAIALAQRHNVMILGAHHGRKAGGDEGDSVLGSTATFGAVDTLMTYARNGDMRTVSTIQRDGKDMPETVLKLDLDTGWLTAGGTKTEAQAAELAQDVFAFIAETSEPVTIEEIISAMEGRAKTIREAVRQLVNSGRLSVAGRGVKNDPRKFWAIPA